LAFHCCSLPLYLHQQYNADACTHIGMSAYISCTVLSRSLTFCLASVQVGMMAISGMVLLSLLLLLQPQVLLLFLLLPLEVLQ